MMIDMVKVGQVVQTLKHGPCLVKNCDNLKAIIVEFDDGTQVCCKQSRLKSKTLKNPNTKIFGIGFLGKGEYSQLTHRLLYSR